MSRLLPIEARDIIRRACLAVSATEAELFAPGHNVKLARARFAVMVALRGLGWSYPRIAKAINRSNATVIHGLRKARTLRACDPGFPDLLALVWPKPAGCEFIRGVTDQGPPRAAPHIWPYPGHGTLADQWVHAA